MEPECSLPLSQEPAICAYPVPSLRPLWMVRNTESYYDEELLAYRPTFMLEDRFFRLPASVYTISLQLPYILGVVPPGDEPCRGDRDPLTTVEINSIMHSLQKVLQYSSSKQRPDPHCGRLSSSIHWWEGCCTYLRHVTISFKTTAVRYFWQGLFYKQNFACAKNCFLSNDLETKHFLLISATNSHQNADECHAMLQTSG
jgi:hypothetical protein